MILITVSINKTKKSEHRHKRLPIIHNKVKLNEANNVQND